MPPELFLDTMFVIALINTRDQHHQQAVELSIRYEGYPMLTTEGVLLEIGNGLARGYKQEAIGDY